MFLLVNGFSNANCTLTVRTIMPLLCFLVISLLTLAYLKADLSSNGVAQILGILEKNQSTIQHYEDKTFLSNLTVLLIGFK